MNPFIPLFISLAETLIQDEPEIVADVQAILAKKNPTPADWLALHQKVLAKSYADYVPESALPQDENPVVAAQPPETNAPISQTSDSGAAGTQIPPYLSDGTPNPAFKH